MCKDCGRKFTELDTLEGKQTPTKEIGIAIAMFYDGLSFSEVSRQLEGIFHDFVAPSTVYRWVMEYSQEAIKLLDKYKAKTSNTWVVDETVIGISGENLWYWDVIDEKTRFLIDTHLSKSRTIADAVALFEKCIKRVDTMPRFIISDKLPAYIDGIERVFGADARHIQSQGMTSEINTNLIERFHSTLKQRTKVMRDLKTKESAQIILDGFVVHYNFFRPHEWLGNTTPAKAAGIKIPCDTWEDLLRFIIY
jgi:transposase-like protein